MNTEGLSEFTTEELAAVANPEKAAPMAAYMKTDQPFYGVPKAGRTLIYREMIERFPPRDRDEYREAVLGLWVLPHREQQYLALAYAKAFPQYVTLSSVPLYRHLIVDGAWWDLVDDIAVKLVGGVLFKQRGRMTPKVRAWIDHKNMWLRRTAIIAQIGHKADTDEGLLFDACAARLHESEFFISKAGRSGSTPGPHRTKFVPSPSTIATRCPDCRSARLRSISTSDSLPPWMTRCALLGMLATPIGMTFGDPTPTGSSSRSPPISRREGRWISAAGRAGTPSGWPAGVTWSPGSNCRPLPSTRRQRSPRNTASMPASRPST